MSKAQNPMTGRMSGSMANFVTTTHGGDNVIRAKAFNPRDANTPAQQLHRSCFKLIRDEYINFGGITDEGFPEKLPGQSAYNLFMAVNLSGAINKSGSEPVVDYSKFQVSGGSLPQVVVISAAVEASGIRVAYQTYVKIPKVNATDEMVLVVRMNTGELLVEKQIRGAEGIGYIRVDCPGIQAAEVKCCYLFARSSDGKKASPSTYIALEG